MLKSHNFKVFNKGHVLVLNMHAAQNGNTCATSCVQFEKLKAHLRDRKRGNLAFDRMPLYSMSTQFENFFETTSFFPSLMRY